jgi:hypothetical protein
LKKKSSLEVKEIELIKKISEKTKEKEKASSRRIRYF